jgi:hypothetical protein
MGWEGLVECVGDRTVLTEFWVRKPEGKKPLEGLGIDRGIILK